jgi:uncharacterized protein HemY
MKRRIAVVFVLLTAALVISLILTISVGSVRISANVVYKILKANFFFILD